MSLINKMLQDLENRRGGGDDGLSRLVSGQLRSSQAAPPRRYRALVGFAAVVVVVGAAGFLLLHAYRERGPALNVPEHRTVAKANIAPAPRKSTVLPLPAAPRRIQPLGAGVGSPAPPTPGGTAALASRAAPPAATPAVSQSPVVHKSSTGRTSPRRRRSDVSARFRKVPRHMTVAQQSDRIYRQAVGDLQNRHEEAAIKKLNTALVLDPANVDARELLAGVLLRQGDQATARTLLEDGHRREPNNLSFTMTLAHIYLNEDNTPKALSLLESAKTTAGDDPDYLAFLGALYEQVGRNGAAAQAYSQAVAARPQAATWWLGLGIALEGDKHWNEARDAYQRARDTQHLTPELDRYAAARLAALKNK